jgi:phenylpropionate dioxygenase-like ring-hydroxylating dioxygenase large terminal subunit
LSPVTPEDAAAPEDATVPEDAAAPEESDGLQESDGGRWQAVAASGSVTDGPLQVWLDGRPWVLLRLDGRLVGFADRCPHRLAPLSAGWREGNTLRCGYHGWRFDGDGRVVSIPSLGEARRLPPACLTVLPTRERGGTVFASVPFDHGVRSVATEDSGLHRADD